MIAKCANPSCAVSFRYLHEGKVFKLEIGHPAADVARPKPPMRIEHFWLCTECSQSLTLILRNGKVFTRPLGQLTAEQPLVKAAHA